MKARPLTSAQNPRVKLVRRLHRRRHRARLRLFLVEGPRLMAAALDAQAPLREVFCTEEFLARHAPLAARLEEAPAPLWIVPGELMTTLAATEHSQGLCAVAEAPADAEALPAVERGLLVLALDAVSDPGNVGAAVRVAHAAGCRLVVFGAGCCDRFSPKAVRASAGGLFSVAARSTGDLPGALRALQARGARIVAAEPRGPQPCWAADLTGPTVLVVGGEVRGVSPSVAAAADARVAIPMPGGAESLNAAAAAAVLLYEAVRQRAQTGR